MNKISFNSSDLKNNMGELKVFKRSTSQDSVISNSSNPFGISFKGKVLEADIFESQDKKNDKVSFTSKIKNSLKSAAFVGTIADLKKSFNSSLANMFPTIKKATEMVSDSLVGINKKVDAISQKVERNVKNMAKLISSLKINTKLTKTVKELENEFAIKNELLEGMSKTTTQATPVT